MSVHGWMDKEIVVYIQNGILFHLKKDSATYNNMDEPGRQYAKCNKPDRDKKKNPA